VPGVLLADVVTCLEAAYPPALAESWDAVGLVCGDPAADVRRVLFAVDPVEAVAAQALEQGAELLVTHHPLYLRGTTTVAASTAKGRVVHALVRGGCALYVAHTNADRADPGVSDALADLFDLRDISPLQPTHAALDTLAVTVPVPDADRVRDALLDAGAGQVGSYDRVSWTATGTGRFRPRDGARPAIGRVGEVETVQEVRIEVVLEPGRRQRVLAAMRAAHPYEEVAFDLHAQVAQPGRTGLGRVGELPAPLTLRALTDLAARVLPATGWGVRAAGDPDAVVSRLAVSGGAGDSVLGAAASSGAQAFLTSDLRHHPASEAPAGLALLDAAHWATEWPWLSVAAARLSAETGLTAGVSRLVTDPFCLSSRSPHA
jgi:dinuclear metal center YbgI/SA1388 family protein